MSTKSRPRTARSYIPYFEDFQPTAEDYESQINNIGAVTASADKFLFRAPVDLAIKAVYVLDDTTLAASLTAYWSFQVALFRAADYSSKYNLLSSLATTETVGLTANTPRDLGADQNLDLRAGDVLELQITETGSATNLVDLFVQVDYVPYIMGGTTTSTSTTTTTTTSTTTTSSSTSSTITVTMT